MANKKPIKPVKEPLPKKKCTKCGKDLTFNKFYNTNSKLSEGKMDICKLCLKELIDCENLDSVYSILQLMDIPFLKDYWNRASENNPKNPWSVYIRMANSKMNEFKDTSWKDSIFENIKTTSVDVDVVKQTNINKENYNLEDLKEKYGYGYPDEEYYLFERKYQQLRPSIQLLTTMHDEFFREYCVDKVKETLAKSKGDFKEAKEWASMAKDASTAGKLNPSQMSKSDLSGGMDTFGQLSRMLEQTQKGELLGILPKFIEKPKDKVDIVLWLHINAIRDIKGLPPCEYKEIYKFYEDRKQSYENQMLDNNLEDEENE